MRVFFLSFFLSVSVLTKAHVTEDFPNARTLFKHNMVQQKGAYAGGIVASTVIPLFGWLAGGLSMHDHPYLHSKRIYLLFKSAHVLQNTLEFKENELKKAKKRLDVFLRKLKVEVIKKENSYQVRNHNDIPENQKEVNIRISKWAIEDLALVLHKADECIPLIIGNPDIKLAVYWTSKFIENLLSASGDTNQTVFEFETAKERKVLGLPN